MTDLTFNIVALGDAFKKIVDLGDSVERLGIKLDELDHKKATPKIDVDTTAANAKIDDLNRKINSNQGLSGGVNNFQTALIGLGATLGAGALSGGALLTIPAAVSAIGIAAVHTNADVQTAFGDLQSTAKATLVQGFAPFVPTLVAIAAQGKTTIAGMGNSFAQASVAAAPLLQTVSTGLMKAASDGVAGTVPLLQGLAPVAQALADDFGKVQRGVEGFLSHLDVGGAASGLSILGTDVEQILPAVGGLVSEVIPLANAFLSDLGPALRDTASDLSILTPIISGAGAVVSFLGPDIATLGPILLGVMGITKLMTGSWLAFGAAGSMIKPVVTDVNGTLTSLGSRIGITTAAQNAENKVTLDAILVRAQLAKQTAETIALEAAFAAEEAGTAEAELAAVAAADELTVADVALAEAEAAAAGATEGLMFSLGPLGIALGAAALLALPFIAGMGGSSKAASNLSGELNKLQQAASDTQALSHLFQADPQAEQQLATLQRYGVTLKDLAEANNGNVEAQRKVADASKQALDVIDATIAADQKQVDAAGIAAAGLDEATGATTEQTDAQKKATDALNADKAARDQANQTYQDAKTQVDATTAAHKALTSTQEQAAGVAAALGINIGMVTTEFNDLATGTKYAMNATQQMSDTILGQVIAVGTANAVITNYFKQADQSAQQASQSLVDSNHSYGQSITAVADAEHSAAQSAQAVTAARQGVVIAERSVTDAMANEVIAENNVTKAQVARAQAQTNLNVATQTAIDQLKSLHLQMADQVTNEESARVSLFDQTLAAKAFGVTPANAADVAAMDVTSANEAKVNAAIALVKAQNALNNTLNAGVNLQAQVAAADKAGVEGAPGVISAQQALASAGDQVTASQQALVKAHQSVSDAQATVLKAEQGVTDALYNERKARQAVSDAVYNQGKAYQAVTAAQQALTKAQDDASRSSDIGTAAGLRNYGMLKQLADQLYANEPRLQADNDLIAGTSKVFGISSDAAQVLLEKLGVLTGKQYNIDINAVASADLTQLNASYSKILAAGHRATVGVGAFAEGGRISGPGTGTSDSIPAITNTGGLLRVSNGEFIVNALSARKNLPLLEMINSSRGYAAGGQVDPAYEALSMGAFGGLYQGGVDVLTAMGIPAPPSLPPYVAPAIAAGGGGNATPAQGGSAAQAQAYAQSIMGRYGWGPEQWIPWLKLGNEESGWNAYAINKSSGAYGIGQSLGHGHPYNLGDYVAQVDWMANYIKGRYRNPAAAWAFETSHVPNWYRDGGPIIDALRAPKVRDNGGPIDPGWNMIYNGTGRSETSRSGTQEDALLAELRAMRKDMKNLQSVSVAAPQGSSASEVADMVIRRLAHRGRG